MVNLDIYKAQWLPIHWNYRVLYIYQPKIVKTTQFNQVETAKIKAIHSRLISRAVESHCDTIVVCQQHSHLRELANSILAFKNVKFVFCEASNSLFQAETIILLFGRSIKLVNFWLNKCNCLRGLTYGVVFRFDHSPRV